MKILTFLILLTNYIGFSQTQELCNIVFSNTENFNVLKAFNGKIPKEFKIIDSTETWNPNVFYLENLNLKDENIMMEIKRKEHHPYHYTYIFSNNSLNEKISDNEKQILRQTSLNIKSKKIVLKGKNYETVKNSKVKKGYYFLISEPVYSQNGKFAFINISVKRKHKFLGEKIDDYFANLVFMLEYTENEKWKQIGLKENLIL